MPLHFHNNFFPEPGNSLELPRFALNAHEKVSAVL